MVCLDLMEFFDFCLVNPAYSGGAPPTSGDHHCCFNPRIVIGSPRV